MNLPSTKLIYIFPAVNCLFCVIARTSSDFGLVKLIFIPFKRRVCTNSTIFLVGNILASFTFVLLLSTINFYDEKTVSNYTFIEILVKISSISNRFK